MELRRGRHVVTNLHVHLVFVTRYRRGIFDADALARLRESFGSVAEDFAARLVECNGEADHVHLLLEYPPTVALSKLVNSLKGVGSRLLSGIARICGAGARRGCGRRAISPPAAAEPRWTPSRTMSGTSVHRRLKAALSLPRLKARASRAVG